MNKRKTYSLAPVRNEALPVLILALFILFTDTFPLEAQDRGSYSFLVAGHAYGSHEGTNTGLHPPLLARLEGGLDTLADFIVLTGDIVNHSNAESWAQVAEELSGFGLPSYYVMGNHDNNDAGREVFIKKHGATHYSFPYGKERFIVLNSTEDDRSISQDQLAFLEEEIRMAGDTTRSVFIFFHEILWNSLSKYREVRSNSRSRYENIAGLSNYWEEVHPLLTARPLIRFYVVGGDIGGNPDAVAAFFDRWENVTLLASGMGEVPEENCLLVRVEDSTVETRLEALDPDMELPSIEYFSVPPAPDSIRGPLEVDPGQNALEYQAAEVPFATAYHWELPVGLSGAGTGRTVLLDADPGFEGGMLSVSAERDGFGTGPPAILEVAATTPSGTPEPGQYREHPLLIWRGDRLCVCLPLVTGTLVKAEIYDLLGRLEYAVCDLPVREGELVLPFSESNAGTRIVRLTVPGMKWKWGFVLPQEPSLLNKGFFP